MADRDFRSLDLVRQSCNSFDQKEHSRGLNDFLDTATADLQKPELSTVIGKAMER